MSSFKQRLRLKKDDLQRCETCDEPEQQCDLIRCASCRKYFHPIKCLKLSEATFQLIRQSSGSSTDSSKSTSSSSAGTDSNEWCCPNCKSCCICGNSNRSTRLSYNKADSLLICERCDDGFHKYCAKMSQGEHHQNSKSANSSSKSGIPKLCLKCSKLTSNNKSPAAGKLTVKEHKPNKMSNNLKVDAKLEPDLKNVKNESGQKARKTRSKSSNSDVNSNGE